MGLLLSDIQTPPHRQKEIIFYFSKKSLRAHATAQACTLYLSKYFNLTSLSGARSVHLHIYSLLSIDSEMHSGAYFDICWLILLLRSSHLSTLVSCHTHVHEVVYKRPAHWQWGKNRVLFPKVLYFLQKREIMDLREIKYFISRKSGK